MTDAVFEVPFVRRVAALCVVLALAPLMVVAQSESLAHIVFLVAF